MTNFQRFPKNNFRQISGNCDRPVKAEENILVSWCGFAVFVLALGSLSFKIFFLKKRSICSKRSKPLFFKGFPMECNRNVFGTFFSPASRFVFSGGGHGGKR